MKEKKKKPSQFKESLSQRPKGVIALYLILRIIVVAVLIRSIFARQFEGIYMCTITLLLFLMPIFLEHKLNIELPSALEVIILLFIFAHAILGELDSYYITHPYWDTMLHTTCGFLTAAVGFSMIDILNQNGHIKFQMSPAYCAVAAFCFSMTIGVFWEFFEFAMDYFFRMDMQKDTVIHAFASTHLDPTASNIAVQVRNIQTTAVNGQLLPINGYLDIGLFDTMEDLFVNFIGALVFSVLGFFHMKHKGKSKIASRFIPVFRDKHKPSEPTKTE